MKRSAPAAGRLDTQVTLSRVTQGTDGAGGNTKTFTPYATPWAHVQPLRGKEFRESNQDSGTVEFRVTMRWRGDVLRTDRVTLPAGQVLEIVAPINVNNMDHTLELMCAAHD